MSSFFSELKRRNVLRVAAAYAVVSWLLLQVGDIAADNLSFPDWFMPMLMVVLGLGFPVALLLSWAFELTPSGMMKTEDVDAHASIRHNTGQKLNYVIIAALVLALGYFVFERQSMPGVPSEEIANSDSTADQGIESPGPISIAVLPFVDLSAAGDQEYFGDGIAEEILNVLAKLEGLQVTSRTTAFSLKGKNFSIPEIAAKLNVSYILEGSIRSARNTVRVTAQLIDVASDSHLWSETFDRQLDDIFAIQDEISASIAEALKIELVGEAAVVGDRPTNNLDAYQLYLQGHHLIRQRGADNLNVAAGLLEAAVELDPDFALAWVELGIIYTLIPSYSDNHPQGEFYPRAEVALERAEALNPDLAQIWATRGLMRVNQYEFEESLTFLERAVILDPRNESSWLWLGLSLGVVGYIDESIEALNRAYEIAPTTGINPGWLAISHHARGDYELARRYSDESIALGWVFSHYGRGLLFLESGNPEQAKTEFRAFSRNMDYPEDIFSPYVDGYFNPDLRPGLSSRLYALVGEGWNVAAFVAGFMIQDVPFLKYHLDSDASNKGTQMARFWNPMFRSLLNTPELKEFFLSTGMVDLWRSRGWPDFCRAVGEDDFICE